MGMLQKRCCTTGKKALVYRVKGHQNTDTALLALRLGVVLYLLKNAENKPYRANLHGFPVRRPICHIVPISCIKGGSLRELGPWRFWGWGEGTRFTTFGSS